MDGALKVPRAIFMMVVDFFFFSLPFNSMRPIAPLCSSAGGSPGEQMNAQLPKVFHESVYIPHDFVDV